MRKSSEGVKVDQLSNSPGQKLHAMGPFLQTVVPLFLSTKLNYELTMKNEVG
jgi:hypothetical protein